jgi:hypothetical protein
LLFALQNRLFAVVRRLFQSAFGIIFSFLDSVKRENEKLCEKLQKKREKG